MLSESIAVKQHLACHHVQLILLYNINKVFNAVLQLLLQLAALNHILLLQQHGALGFHHLVKHIPVAGFHPFPDCFCIAAPFVTVNIEQVLNHAVSHITLSHVHVAQVALTVVLDVRYILHSVVQRILHQLVYRCRTLLLHPLYQVGILDFRV